MRPSGLGAPADALGTKLRTVFGKLFGETKTYFSPNRIKIRVEMVTIKSFEVALEFQKAGH